MPGREPEHPDDELHHGQRLAGMDVGQRPQDAFGTTGGARRVQHRRAEALVGDGLVGNSAMARLRRAGTDPTRASMSTARKTSTFGVFVAASRATSSFAADGDEHLGVAVVDDVGDLVGGEVRVDARVVQAGSLGGRHRLEVAEVVLHEHRHVVAPHGARRPVQVSEAIGVRLELGERQMTSPLVAMISAGWSGCCSAWSPGYM